MTLGRPSPQCCQNACGWRLQRGLWTHLHTHAHKPMAQAHVREDTHTFTHFMLTHIQTRPRNHFTGNTQICIGPVRPPDYLRLRNQSQVSLKARWGRPMGRPGGSTTEGSRGLGHGEVSQIGGLPYTHTTHHSRQTKSTRGH